MRKIFRMLLSLSSPWNLLPVPSKQSTSFRTPRDRAACSALLFFLVAARFSLESVASSSLTLGSSAELGSRRVLSMMATPASERSRYEDWPETN